MKFLNLDSAYRQWLNSNAALDFDKDLNEKFIGLMHDESIFFAKISNAAICPIKIKTVDELECFIELHERHELALALALALAFSVKHASIFR